MESVASLGIVVIAPATSKGWCKLKDADDLLHSLEGSKKNINLHKALEFVDWSRTAIFGFSMGAGATIVATARALKEENIERYNVKVALASHAHWDSNTLRSRSKDITIPFMVVSGTEDKKGNIMK